MVPLDFPKIEDWSAFEFGVEIFITNQYDKFIDCNGDGYIRMAFLNPQAPSDRVILAGLKGSKG